MQENQVEITRETLGEAAKQLLGTPGVVAEPVDREKFHARQRVLWRYLDLYRRSVAEGREQPSFMVAFKPGTGWAMRTLADVARDLETTLQVNQDQFTVVREALQVLAGERQWEEVLTYGTVLHYGDHWDTMMRFEIQIKLADNPASIERDSVPDLIFTVGVALLKHPANEEFYPSVRTIDVGRLEWDNMLMEANAIAVDPQKVVAPPEGSIFAAMPLNIYGDEHSYKKFPEVGETVTTDTVLVGRRDLRTIAANAAKTAKRAANLAGDTFNMFGVSADMLYGEGGQAPEVSFDTKIALLFERGKRMDEVDYVGLEKMKVVVRSKDDIKHFLDEVFRHGNLWLYNALIDAFKTQAQGSVSEDSLVFRLTVKGNWQEYRGPVNAKIKLKTLFSKTGVVLSTVKGELQI